MLEKIREGSTGIVSKVIIGLIILSFVFAGVGSYINSSSDISAAEVNGEKITFRTLDRVYQSERARLESQLGEMFNQLAANGDYLRTLRQNTLQRLIDEKLVEQAAEELGLRVSNADVLEAIANMPEFQIAGQFNNDRFQAILLQAGFSPNDFKTFMRRQMTRQQLARAVVFSDFALPSESESLIKLRNQTRDARYVEIPSNLFEADVEITDAERDDYYLNNIALFDTDEKVNLSYVELKVDDLLDDVVVTDDAINEYYEQNLGSYRSEEQRRVSHILFEFGEDESASEAEAAATLAELQQGADFAELAKEKSDDTFSAELGGDLDWFARGVMDPAFDEAAFALAEVGDVSEVVRSDFGFHIIKLTDLQAEDVQSLDEVYVEISATLTRELATERYLELQQSMAELAFEMPDSLDEVAELAELEVKESGLFSRIEAQGTVADANVLNSAFSVELIEDGVNSDVIDLNDEHFVILRVVGHEPQRTKAKEEVLEQIDAALTSDKSQELAKQWADQLAVTAAENEEAFNALLLEKTLEVTQSEAVTRFANDIPMDIREALFEMSAVSESTSINLGSGNVAYVQLLAINDVDSVEEAEVESNMQRMASTQGQATYTSLIEVLNSKAEVITGTTELPEVN